MEPTSPHPSHSDDIWVSLFSGEPEVRFEKQEIIFHEGEAASFVYVIVDGAVMELKGDRSHDGHLVTLCGVGDIFGIRVISTISHQHSVRAIALCTTIVRVMKRDRFMRLVMQHADLFMALSVCLSKRQRFTQSLEDSCSHASLRSHLEYVLGAVADTFGMDHDHASIAIPEDVLVEMVGCPKPILDPYVRLLEQSGTIEIDRMGIRLRAI